MASPLAETTVGEKVGILLLHLDAVFNALLRQLPLEFGNFLLQADSFLGIRIFFSQLASQLQLFLVDISPNLAGVFKKCLALLVQFVDFLIAKVALVTGRAKGVKLESRLLESYRRFTKK